MCCLNADRDRRDVKIISITARMTPVCVCVLGGPGGGSITHAAGKRAQNDVRTPLKLPLIFSAVVTIQPLACQCHAQCHAGPPRWSPTRIPQGPGEADNGIGTEHSTEHSVSKCKRRSLCSLHSGWPLYRARAGPGPPLGPGQEQKSKGFPQTRLGVPPSTPESPLRVILA